jgi:hypothetical protein
MVACYVFLCNVSMARCFHKQVVQATELKKKIQSPREDYVLTFSIIVPYLPTLWSLPPVLHGFGSICGIVLFMKQGD